MYDMGSGGNRINFGDLNALDAPAAYTLALTLCLDTTTGNYIFGKRNNATAQYTGWLLYHSTGTIWMQHGVTTEYQPGADPTGALSTGTYYRYVITFNDSTNTTAFYANNSSRGSLSTQTGTIAANSIAVSIGDESGDLGGSLDGKIADVMWWDVVLTADEISADYAGQIPRPASLKFWAPGRYDPGSDIISQTAGTKTGTVAIVEQPGLVRALRGYRPSKLGPVSIVLVYKVIDETLQLTEGKVSYVVRVKIINETLQFLEGKVSMISLVKVIAETLNISETAAWTTVVGLVQVINETLNLYDGDSLDTFDPGGYIDKTESDGTVWRRVFPPFTRRTKWTS